MGPSVRRPPGGQPYNVTSSLSRSVASIKQPQLLELWSKMPVSVPFNSRPNFIIKWGPPASGKTTVIRRILPTLGWPAKSYINFSVDDPIEASSYFRNTSQNLAAKYLANTNKNQNSIVARLNRTTNANATAFGKVYRNVRGALNNNSLSFGRKLDKMMMDALKARMNITFETTGSTEDIFGQPAWPSWIWEKYRKETGRNLSDVYNVIIVFPLVPFEVLWERYRRRAARMFLNGKGFRFAASKRLLLSQYLTSYNNFLRNISSPEKMRKVIKIVVVPQSKLTVGRPKVWSPAPRGTNIQELKARLRSRNRQEIVNLVNKYINSIINNNVPV